MSLEEINLEDLLYNLRLELVEILMSTFDDDIITSFDNKYFSSSMIFVKAFKKTQLDFRNLNNEPFCRISNKYLSIINNEYNALEKYRLKWLYGSEGIKKQLDDRISEIQAELRYCKVELKKLIPTKKENLSIPRICLLHIYLNKAGLREYDINKKNYVEIFKDYGWPLNPQKSLEKYNDWNNKTFRREGNEDSTSNTKKLLNFLEVAKIIKEGSNTCEDIDYSYRVKALEIIKEDLNEFIKDANIQMSKTGLKYKKLNIEDYKENFENVHERS